MNTYLVGPTCGGTVPAMVQPRWRDIGRDDGGMMDMHCVRREPCKVLVFSGCKSHPATGSLQPVRLWRIGAAVEETKPSEPSRQTGESGQDN